MRNRHIIVGLFLVAVISIITAQHSFAQGTNYGTVVIQGSGSFYNQAIWKPVVAGVPTGTAVGITNGNVYTCIQNGTNTVGNNLSNTRIRSQAIVGVQVFPTNSVLVLNTNTELRIKGSGSGVYTLYYGGSNGSPGLILNGGLIDNGDGGTIYTINGLINVAAQSYISHGANGGGGGAANDTRALVVSGILSGAGNLVIMNCTNTVAQVISNVNNTFSGQWIVQCGWLRGAVNNSLGTNSVTVDPLYSGFTNDMPLATSGLTPASTPGPAILEANYDFNCAGRLILTNGGVFTLHQNCAFSSAFIEGTPLSLGLHFYSELNSNFPANFPAGGSGSITIQPFGPLIVGPQIVLQPLNEQVYVGGQARFNATASGVPISTNWSLGASQLVDGGDIIGSTTTNLLITSVDPTNVGNYTIKFVDAHANIAVSHAVSLTIAQTNGEAYEAAVIASHPYAFYQLNEGSDVSTNPPAFDNVNGYDAIYGNAVSDAGNGITGPQPSTGWPGFVSTNGAASFATANPTSHLSLATPWNLNTNTVTLTAWINPSGAENANTGLIFCRGGNTVAGLNFASALDANFQATLGYNWNNDSANFSWNSGIEVPSGQWSFVALSVTPTNATVYMMNSNGIVSATHVNNHPVQGFNGGTLIADDSAGANGARVFNGTMDDVAVYNRALSASDLATLFSAGSGVTSYAPLIVGQPQPLTLYAGQTATFIVAAGGSAPVTYQWMADTAGNGIYAPLTEGGRFSGTTSQTLNVANISTADANNYKVVVSNPFGAPASSTPALLTVLATGPAETNSLNFGSVNIQEAAGNDWNTLNQWTDGVAASTSAVSNPGTTYDVLTGQRLRNPAGSTSSTFPGVILRVDGPGVLFDGNTAAGANTGEFRTKHSIDPATIIIPNLVLNGGQLDAGDNGTIIIQGAINVATNSAFTVDSAAGVAGSNVPRNYQVDSVLTGGGNLRYDAIQGANPFTSSLDLTSSSNTFTGAWTVDSGTLVGGGSNSLGTNSIVINSAGGLQTLYDVHSPSANLVISGQMFLNQNDTFRSLFVNGIPLAVGTYTAAQLNTSYPTNFPATWAPQYGATNTTNMSGSITVLLQPAPTITQQPTPPSFVGYPNQTAQFTATAGGNVPLFLFWQFGTTTNSFTTLSDNAQISGSATNTITISNLTATNVGFYRLLASNSIGTTVSLPASISLLATGPATNLTLDFGGTPFVEAIGQDWDTTNAWSDGQPADTSAFSNPGSTYEMVVGSRLRNPANVLNSSFPGMLLTVDGAGALDPNIVTTAEIRFKHTPGGVAGNGIVFFPHLVLAGGQLDNGDNGLVQIFGHVDVVSNSAIFTDVAAGQDRPVEIDGLLTGTGTITYQDFDIGLNGGLNIAGNNNTFSGQWNVLVGCLVGSGSNSLGTNNITVAGGAALETLYDVHNLTGDLNLSGQLFLHQNDTFATVEVNGTNVAPGTYTFAQLNTTYPATFPSSWVSQSGSTFSSGSGSLTVLGATGPSVSVNFSVGASGLTLNWSQGTLQEATSVLGPWTVVTGATSPFTVQTTDPAHFYRVKVQ